MAITGCGARTTASARAAATAASGARRFTTHVPVRVRLRVVCVDVIVTVVHATIITVTTIGIATLGSLVGQGGLGDLIFTGIQNQNYDEVVAGAITIALLAIIFDLALLGLQIVLNRGRSAVSVA